MIISTDTWRNELPELIEEELIPPFYSSYSWHDNLPTISVFSSTHCKLDLIAILLMLNKNFFKKSQSHNRRHPLVQTCEICLIYKWEKMLSIGSHSFSMRVSISWQWVWSSMMKNPRDQSCVSFGSFKPFTSTTEDLHKGPKLKKKQKQKTVCWNLT